MFRQTIVSITLAAFLTACGGGGGGSTPTLPDLSSKNYNLRNLLSQNYSFQMPFHSSANNDSYEYTLSTTVKNKVNNLTPIDFIGSFDNKTRNASQAINFTWFVNDTANVVKTIDNITNNECTLKNTPTPFPTDAKIGDSGVGSTLECNDGTMNKSTWTLLQSGSEAILKFVTNTYDATDNLESTETDYYTINENGTIIKAKIVFYYTDSKVSVSSDTVPVTTR